jgi:hypothetical protein
MLKDAIQACPDALWTDAGYTNPFWHVAYHALFYTHLYVQRAGEDFAPWERHREQYEFLGPMPWPPHEKPKIGEPYTVEDVLDYHAFCAAQVDEIVPTLDLEAESGFPWVPLSKLGLQIYNIRHLQHHTGQLVERLRTGAEVGVNWRIH